MNSVRSQQSNNVCLAKEAGEPAADEAVLFFVAVQFCDCQQRDDRTEAMNDDTRAATGSALFVSIGDKIFKARKARVMQGRIASSSLPQ